MLDKDGFITTLKQMPSKLVPTIDPLRIHAIELSHPLRQTGFWGLHYEVVVVSHLAIGMAAPIELLADILEYREPLRPVVFVKVDVLTTIATRGHMVEAASKFDTERSGHAIKSRTEMRDCKT